MMKKIFFQRHIWLLVFASAVFVSSGHSKDLDVLILTPEMDKAGSRVRTGFDTAKTTLYLDAMLKATPSFAGATCTSHTDVNVDSLQKSTTTRATELRLLQR